MIQNPKFNTVECIEGVDNLKQYLVSQRSVDNFKISVDSVIILARDSGIDPKFPISNLRKMVYLFVYEGVMNQLQIPSRNSRSLQLMDDLPYYLSAIRYSAFCMFHKILLMIS
ncbi:uncharacterized protein TNIN_271 [Trichonephila inaurata madagascariensis]|uniref:Uncharacterized protein n=1 Tax=Trichonephila inaurata madagascariensis TaxID=2747483 RepID=A0A8X6YPW2_9ARAC|nr:uncharacterized protein TNIN_271 [Trichonephila inaurata madagascariensis]